MIDTSEPVGFEYSYEPNQYLKFKVDVSGPRWVKANPLVNSNSEQNLWNLYSNCRMLPKGIHLTVKHIVNSMHFIAGRFNLLLIQLARLSDQALFCVGGIVD